MHIEITALNNSMLHIKKSLLALISSTCMTPLLHADLLLFTLGFFILTYLYLSLILPYSPLASLPLSLRLSVLKQNEVIYAA